MRSEGEECAAEDAGYTAEDEPGPAMRGVADVVTSGEGAGNGDKTGGSVETSGVRVGEADGLYEGCGVCCYHAA